MRYRHPENAVYTRKTQYTPEKRNEHDEKRNEHDEKRNEHDEKRNEHDEKRNEHDEKRSIHPKFAAYTHENVGKTVATENSGNSPGCT